MKKIKYISYLFLLFFNSCFVVYSQGIDSAIGHKYYQNVTFDLYDKTITGYLPFDIPFVLSGQLPPAVSKIELLYIPKNDVSIYTYNSGTINITDEIKDDTKYRCKLITKFHNLFHHCHRKKQGSKISQSINAQSNEEVLKDNGTNAQSATGSLNIYRFFEEVPDINWSYSSWERSPIGLKIVAKDKDRNDEVKQDAYHIYMEPLKPNKEYLFFMRITYSLSNNPEQKTEIVQIFKDITDTKIQSASKIDADEAKEMLTKSNNSVLFLDKISLENDNYGLFELKQDNTKSEVTPTLLNENHYKKVAEYIQFSFKKNYGVKVDLNKIIDAIDSIVTPNDFSDILSLNKDYAELITIAENHSSTILLESTSELETVLLNGKMTDELIKLKKFGYFQKKDLMTKEILLGRADFQNMISYLPEYSEVKSKNDYNAYIINLDKLILDIDNYVSVTKTKFTDENSLALLNPARSRELNETKNSLEAKLKKLKEKPEDNKSEIEATQKAINDLDVIVKSENIKAKTEIHTFFMPLDKLNLSIKLLMKYDIITLSNKLQNINNFWDKITNKMAFDIEQRADLSNSFQNTTSNSFMTRAEYYISGDIGMAAMCFGAPFTSNWGIKTLQPYLGVNFNVCAINRQAHYGLFSTSLNKNPIYRAPVLRSTSVVIGATFQDLEINLNDSDAIIKETWTDRSNVIFMTGLAIRLTDYIRLSAGASWYRYRYSYSPFETNYKLGAGFYFGLSLDLDVRKYIQGVGGLIFPEYFDKISKMP